MLAIMVRDMPQHERANFDSSRGSTETVPFSSLANTCSTSAILTSPFGPLTERLCPLRLTSTPEGTGIGFFPIRNIAQSSEYGADHFAADVLGARFCIRHDPLRRREDRNPEPIVHGGQ